MLKGHGGNIYEAAKIVGCAPSEIVDMSSNIHPFPPPEEFMAGMKERLGEIAQLPEVDSHTLASLLAEKHGLSQNQVLVGNGTTEFIYSIPALLKTRSALILAPTYSDYADSCARSSVKTKFLFAKKEDSFAPDLTKVWEEVNDVDCLFVCNPNNPTGQLIPGEELRRLAHRFPSVLFIVDESYLPFVEEEEDHSMLRGDIPDNCIVLRSFSKIYAIPGLRLGWLAASERTVEILHEGSAPWNVSRPAQIAGEILLEFPNLVSEAATYIQEEKGRFIEGLRVICGDASRENSFIPYSSMVNFLLLELTGALHAPDLAKEMLKRKILIRDCSNFQGLGGRFIRISLKSGKMNDLFLERLGEVLG